MVEKIQIIIVTLMFFICIKNATQGILIPIVMQHYSSFNFIMLTILSQFIVFFALGIAVTTHGPPTIPNHMPEIILSGLCSAFMSILILYSANPERTPVFLQCVFQNVPIIPSSIMRYFIIDKLIVYRKPYIISSLLCITGAIAFSLVPVNFKENITSISWIIMAFFGIVFQAGYNVMQEKYIEKSGDNSVRNKILLMFWSKVVELLTLAALCWLEYFIGPHPFTNPIESFRQSAVLFGTSWRDFVMLEGFIIAYLMSFTLAVYLNSISTNYNMITVIISNPLATLFFYFFSQFNNGIHYPLWIILTSLFLGLVSVICWLNGETISSYRPINEDEDEI